jgi:WGR domain
LKVRYPCQPDNWPSITSNSCPLPMYLFPASAGLSLYPVVGYQDRFPPNQRPRVPIPRPWAQCLQLFESNAHPPTYACYVKYTRRGASGREILAIPGSSWQLAFDAFRKFFKTKTRKDWNDRLDGKPVPISGDGHDEDPFRYEPPANPREPKGLVEQNTTRSERAKEILSRREGSVTMVVPTIEISDGDDDDTHLDVRACTPRGMEW